MNILQLETFLEIVKTKKISTASRNLFISQPTASHRLSTLEEELGFPLIERNKGIRTVSLTPFGEKFIPTAYKWLDLWADLQQQMDSGYKLPLAIGCAESINIHLFSPFFKDLLRGNRGGYVFDLRIHTERSREIHKMIENRDLDAGFVYSLHPNSRLLITPLFAEKMYVLRLKDQVEPQRTAYASHELDIKHEIYTNWSADFQMWHQNAWNAGSPFTILDSEYLLLDYLDAPELWAIAPESVARALTSRNSGIFSYRLLGNPPKRVYYKITHRMPKETHATSLQIFTSLLSEFIANHEFISPL